MMRVERSPVVDAAAMSDVDEVWPLVADVSVVASVVVLVPVVLVPATVPVAEVDVSEL